MSVRITGISSMATRRVLADLAAAFRAARGIDVVFESVGGVEAAKRVQAGEAFDVVVLASDALDKLIAQGHAVAATRTEVVRSPMAIAIRAGARRPDIGSEAALRAAVQSARAIGYSTGPSGTALLALFDRWGIAAAMRNRLVQASPGVPVAQLVADGTAELGFQQLSELLDAPGIEVLGPMPAGLEIVTTFAAARCARSTQHEPVAALLAFLRSPVSADTKRRYGMSPA